MSLLKTVPPEKATGLVAENYRIFTDRGLQPAAPFVLASASPGMQEVMKRSIAYLAGQPNLSDGLRALIRMCVSEAMGYSYCISYNRNILKAMGIANDDQVGRILADPATAPLPEKELAMLLLAIKACTRPEAVRAEDVARLRGLGWTDTDIYDATVQGLNMVQIGILEKAYGLPEGSAC